MMSEKMSENKMKVIPDAAPSPCNLSISMNTYVMSSLLLNKQLWKMLNNLNHFRMITPDELLLPS